MTDHAAPGQPDQPVCAPPETYAVASNPVLAGCRGLHVLFSGESQTRPSHKLGPKLVDYYLLHHVMGGHGTFTSDGVTYDLGPGDAFLITPNRLVSYASDADKPWHYRWIAFQGEGAAELAGAAGFASGSPVVHAGPDSEAPEWMERIRESFQLRRSSAHLTALGCLHLILSDYADRQAGPEAGQGLKPESEIDHTVRQMIHMMSTQYAYPLSIEQIADSLGYSRAYLSRIFKRVTEMTPVTYLLKLRIDKGRQLLRERADLTIEQIAASVGIPDALYFSRQFRRFYNQSPTAYRSKFSPPGGSGSGSRE